MVLDSPGWVLYVKNSNVKKIVCDDLIIQGVLYSKLYGRKCVLYKIAGRDAPQIVHMCISMTAV